MDKRIGGLRLKVDLFITVLFPWTRNFASHFLSPPRCTQMGTATYTAGLYSETDKHPIQWGVAKLLLVSLRDRNQVDLWP